MPRGLTQYRDGGSGGKQWLGTVRVRARTRSLRRVRFFATPWTVVHLQARTLGWVAGDLPDPEIQPTSPALIDGLLPAEPPGKSGTTHPLANGPVSPPIPYPGLPSRYPTSSFRENEIHSLPQFSFLGRKSLRLEALRHQHSWKDAH